MTFLTLKKNFSGAQSYTPFSSDPAAEFKLAYLDLWQL